jgi:phage FluMu protein Com
MKTSDHLGGAGAAAGVSFSVVKCSDCGKVFGEIHVEGRALFLKYCPRCKKFVVIEKKS